MSKNFSENVIIITVEKENDAVALKSVVETVIDTVMSGGFAEGNFQLASIPQGQSEEITAILEQLYKALEPVADVEHRTVCNDDDDDVMRDLPELIPAQLH